MKLKIKEWTIIEAIYQYDFYAVASLVSHLSRYMLFRIVE